MSRGSAVRWLAAMSALVVVGCSGGSGVDPLLVAEPCKFLTPVDAVALLDHPVHVLVQSPACVYSTTPGYTIRPGQATVSVQVQRRIDKADLRRATAGGTTRDLGFRIVHHPVSGLGVPADWVELSFKGSVEGMRYLTVFAQGFEIRIEATGVPDERATAEQAARTVLIRLPQNADACAIRMLPSGPTYVPRGCTGRHSPLPLAGNSRHRGQSKSYFRASATAR